MYVLVIPNVEEDKFFVVDVFNYAPEVSLEWQYYQKIEFKDYSKDVVNESKNTNR